ncbi:MAG: oxidoreductase [Kiritimatiellae bacterium]|nr:oxidoreductase [Kiritimatiellia bacterium]
MNIATIDPGHFHAALVQNRAYPEMDGNAYVFAPPGAELEAHLRSVKAFNSRAENPTRWREIVKSGPDFLQRFSAAAADGRIGRGTVAVLAGRNNLKGRYALAAVEAGCNVLADKPLGITREVFAATERAARLAEKKGLCFADIMTERHDVSSLLRRELARRRDLYGEQETGSETDPAVVETSVHNFCKLVDGRPLRRPEWYYDTAVQGEGITDVTSHLVDLVQWETFPERRLSPGDVEMLYAKSWPTVITPEQFATSTGGRTASDIACEANGEFVWKLRGVHCRVAVRWDFMSPGGDSRCSLMRGTMAEISMERGAGSSGPSVTVRARKDPAATAKALRQAVAELSDQYPGLKAAAAGETGVWRVTCPADAGHESHFSKVFREFLGWMQSGRQDPIYIDNMLVKYGTIVAARELAHSRVKN